MNIQDKISVLLVGGSGQGKSEFIMSMADNSVREKIQPSGGSQTTRTSMRYNIYFSDETEDNKPVEFSIEVTLKKQSEFCQERMTALSRRFNEDDLLFSKLNKGTRFDNTLGRLKKGVIRNDAFFNCAEFGGNEGEAGYEIEKAFDKAFDKEFWSNLPANLFSDSSNEGSEKLGDEETEEKAKALEDARDEFDKKFREFFNDIYNKGLDLILKEQPDVKEGGTFDLDIENNNSEYISRYFKTESGNLSYSSLVKSIEVQCKGFEGYKPIMLKNKISCISMVDTYGLNHADSPNQDELEERYKQLLHRDFNDIKAVLLIQKTWGHEPNFLNYIVKLFKAEPSIVPYIILNKADETGDGTKPKTRNVIDNSKEDIIDVLCDSGVSEKLAEWRASLVPKYTRDYCSVLGIPEIVERLKKSNGESFVQKLAEKNLDSIEKIFSSIRFQKHLGNAFIPVDFMTKTATIEKLLDVKKLINSKSVNINCYGKQFKFFESWHYGSRNAFVRRLKIGNLGYVSEHSNPPDKYDSRWDKFVENSLKNRFTSNDFEADVTNLLIEALGCDEEIMAQTFKETTQAFLDFEKDVLYKGIWQYDNKNKFVPDVISSRILETLYNDKKVLIENMNYSSTDKNYLCSVLNDIYDFDNMRDATISTLFEILKDCYLRYLVPIFRRSNARKLAAELGDVSFADPNDANQAPIINNYIDVYDSALKDDYEELNKFLATVTDCLSK